MVARPTGTRRHICLVGLVWARERGKTHHRIRRIPPTRYLVLGRVPQTPRKGSPPVSSCLVLHASERGSEGCPYARPPGHHHNARAKAPRLKKRSNLRSSITLIVFRSASSSSPLLSSLHLSVPRRRPQPCLPRHHDFPRCEQPDDLCLDPQPLSAVVHRCPHCPPRAPAPIWPSGSAATK